MIRGNDRKDIFLDEQDKMYFIEILKTKKENNRYGLIAFCIMDNHAHLLLQEREEDIVNIMKRINVRYVFYFNKKYKKSGHLFQDRYKSEKIEDENEAKKELIKFTNMEEEDKFIEIDEKRNRMEEDQAIKLWGEIVTGEENLDEKLKNFREKTKLPLRKLAEITGINKDKINKITK